MKECPECGENLADDAVHCGHCGAQVEEGEEDNKETVFGVGALSDEDLEGMEGGGDGDDDGFQLPSPGDMDDASEEPAQQADASPESEGERPGLKGDDDAALAETEALPSLEEGDQPDRQQEGSDLQEGRISSPGGDGGQEDLESSPDLAGQSSPADDGGSPFAGDDQQARTVGGDRGGASGAQTGQSKTDTVPPEEQGPEAGGAEPGGGAEMADTADIVSEPGDEPEPATGGQQASSRVPEQDAAAGAGGAQQQAGGGAQQQAGGAQQQPGGGAQQQAGGGSQQQAGGGAEPGGGSQQQAASRDPMEADSRFGGGGGGGAQADQPPAGGVQREGLAGEQQPQTTADSSDNKTLLIIVGILAAMFLVCGIGGLVFFWMGFP